jgi:hypothetical protein
MEQIIFCNSPVKSNPQRMGKSSVIRPQSRERISWRAAGWEDSRKDIDEAGIGHD